MECVGAKLHSSLLYGVQGEQSPAGLVNERGVLREDVGSSDMSTGRLRTSRY